MLPRIRGCGYDGVHINININIIIACCDVEKKLYVCNKNMSCALHSAQQQHIAYISIQHLCYLCYQIQGLSHIYDVSSNVYYHIS
jgi:hypothetical protein